MDNYYTKAPQYRAVPQEEIDAFAAKAERETRAMDREDAARVIRRAKEAEQARLERRYGKPPLGENKTGSGLPLVGKLPRRVMLDVWRWWALLHPGPERSQHRLIPDMATLFNTTPKQMVRALIALQWAPYRTNPPRGLQHEMWVPPHCVGTAPWAALGEPEPPRTAKEEYVYDLVMADECGVSLSYPRLVHD